MPRPLLLVLFFIFLAFGTKGRIIILKSTIPVWTLLLVILFLALIRPGPWTIEPLLIRYANFIAAIFLLNLYTQSEKGAIHSDLMKILPWMGLQAIITFILANIAPTLFMGIATEKYQFKTILLIFNYHEILFDYSGLKRPDGFFYEPGVFQIYLNIYLYLSLYIYKSYRHGIFSTIALLSTQSTTGLIIGSALWIFKLKSNSKQKIKKGSGVNFLLLIAIGVAVSALSYFNLQEKVSGELQGSSIARQYDFFTGLNLIAEHPLLGIGFDPDRYLELLPQSAYLDTSLSQESALSRQTSNGIIQLYYSLGIPLGFIITIMIFRQRLFPNNYLFFFIIFSSLLSEALVYTPFMLLIAFSGLSRITRTETNIPS